MKFCDLCIHFNPTDNPKTPIKDLCALKKKLEFKADVKGFGDWGFYYKGCKDYKHYQADILKRRNEVFKIEK